MITRHTLFGWINRLVPSRRRIRNHTYEDLTIGGKPARAPEVFKTNDFVNGLSFVPRVVSP